MVSQFKVPGISVIISGWYFDTRLVGIVAEMLNCSNALSLKKNSGKYDDELWGTEQKKYQKTKQNR